MVIGIVNKLVVIIIADGSHYPTINSANEDSTPLRDDRVTPIYELSVSPNNTHCYY